MAPTCCVNNKSMPASTSRCPNRCGHVTVILGPMFSGKTTELLRLHDRQVLARRGCILVKYAGDTRYDEHMIATHSSLLGKGETVKAHRLSEIRDILFRDAVQVVSIDEGQFFDDLAETVEELAQRNKVVCVAALSGTFERKPFPQVSLLLSYANEIKQVTAVCDDCGASAPFTFRSTMDKKVEVIGGSDTYKPLCRECYNSESNRRDAVELRHEASASRENLAIGDVEKRVAAVDDKEDEVPRKIIVLNSPATY
ncbi:unnamed protein product [Caenorhabditis auriculariae]|uniref:Thymidine kinase n=1 Tax=Caenorhabditis auriculariae TaxID=2777116 RepID=A0A8S1HIC3_9PELO|nr:unnamed protein product [Caenorhabditis auriculariae]